jgi:hypothetical protein
MIKQTTFLNRKSIKQLDFLLFIKSSHKVFICEIQGSQYTFYPSYVDG